MANVENLFQNKETTPEERRENARKAGKASGEARRRRKAMREAFEEMLAQKYTNAQGQEMDGTTILCMKQFQNALNGDLKAFIAIRDAVGEAPVQQIELAQIPQETYTRVMEVLAEE